MEQGRSEMNEVVLRRSISPDEAKDLSVAIFLSAFKGQRLWLFVLQGVLFMGIFAVIGAMLGFLTAPNPESAVTLLRIVLSGVITAVGGAILIFGIALGLGIPLGVRKLQKRLETWLGPKRELIVTWYQNGFSIAGWKSQRFFDWADVRRARWGGRMKQFVIVNTPSNHAAEIKFHGFPTDLVPREVLQAWTSGGLLR
jgi:hypothetical protein